MALVLHSGTVRSVPLPDFTLENVIELIGHLPPQVRRWGEAHDAAAGATRQAGEAGDENGTPEEADGLAVRQGWRDALAEIARSGGNYQAGWVYSYALAFRLVPEGNDRMATEAALNGWRKTVRETMAFIQACLWQPLVSALPACVRRVVLIPAGPASLLPLHAGPPEAISVAYAPSIGVWHHCNLRAAGREASSLFLASPAHDLPFAELGAEWLKSRFQHLGRPATVLPRAQATVDAVRTRMPGHGLVSFSGHAVYDWKDPLGSALRCLDGSLTLAEIRHSRIDLATARVVALSACETGVVDVRSGNEFIGLPAGLLESGAPAVIASLWPVSDLSSAFLMDRFFELWLDQDKEMSVGEALQAASLWLKDARKEELLPRIVSSSLPNKDKYRAYDFLKQKERPFSEPFDWAAFAAYGAVV